MWFARFTWSAWDATDPGAVGLRLYRSEDGTEGCAYWTGRDRPAGLPADVSLVKLEVELELAGASAGADAPWHYIVATDVANQHEADFNAWYDKEHLPGLAAVPGTVRAARYRVTEGEGPRYHAAYDLATREAFGSPAWLAVRATPWSARVRPAFRNTRRTMYRRVR
jgi:hypothetical protein